VPEKPIEQRLVDVEEQYNQVRLAIEKARDRATRIKMEKEQKKLAEKAIKEQEKQAELAIK